MKPRFVGVLLAALAACDRTDDHGGSHFKAEDNRSREASGIVYRGEDPVPGAFFQIVSTIPSVPFKLEGLTDLVGSYGNLREVPLEYDFTAKLDTDVLTYRHVGRRFITPSIEGPRTPPRRSWRTKLDVRFSRPVDPTHKVAFFANGDRVFGIDGSLDTGLTLVTNDYTATATIHAVEYVTDLMSAVAYAKLGLASNPDATQLVPLDLEPFDKTALPEVSVGEEINPPTVDLYLTYSRTSFAKLATIPINTTTKVPLIPNAGTAARLAGSVDGAVASSDEVAYDFLGPPLVLGLPKIPIAVAPEDGATVGVDVHLVAKGTGVFEHVLTSEATGATIRVVTAEGDATLPDFAAIGAPVPTGRWQWVVRSYPKLRYAEDLAGIDVRRFQPNATSKPRTLIFR